METYLYSVPAHETLYTGQATTDRSRLRPDLKRACCLETGTGTKALPTIGLDLLRDLQCHSGPEQLLPRFGNSLTVWSGKPQTNKDLHGKYHNC